MAMSSHVVHGFEGHSSGLCRSYEESARYSADSEGSEFGPLVPTLDSISRTVVQYASPAVSGIAVDTLLFSRIGVPLFHRYRVVNRPGTHGDFRGSKMRRMHALLEESDVASLRRRHRRWARDIAAQMSRMSILDTEDRTPDISSRPKVYRRSVFRERRLTRPMALDGSSVATRPVLPHCSEVQTIQALMELALPRFEGLGDGPRQVHRPWMMSTESPDPGGLTELLMPVSVFESGCVVVRRHGGFCGT